MARITSPVTSGGSQCRMRPITVPTSAWNRPPTTIAPISAPMPAPLATGTMTGMKENAVPCMIGNRAPTGPMPIVWNSVATPAPSIDIWIR